MGIDNTRQDCREAPDQSAYRIRSFSLRGARLGDKYESFMRDHAQNYLISAPAGYGVSSLAENAHIDFVQEFGRRAPLIVEIGPGSGEQLVASAQRHPENNYLGLEAWAPGVARCIKTAYRAGVENVRLMQLDAAQALPILFPAQHVPYSGGAFHPDSGACEHHKENPSDSGYEPYYAREVWTFFPDPWRKRKHRKRRIVNPEFARTVAGVLEPEGVWRLATDWENYAWQMRDVLVESPWFELQTEDRSAIGLSAAHAQDKSDDCSGSSDLGVYSGGWAPRWSERTQTRFEQRGIEAGRRVYDLMAVRTDLPCDACPAPPDPWEAAAARGQRVQADQPGAIPAASSRRGWLEEREQA